MRKGEAGATPRKPSAPSRPGRRPGPKGKRIDPKKQAEAAGGEWATTKGLKVGDQLYHEKKWKTVKSIGGSTGWKTYEFEDGTSTGGGSATKFGIKRQGGGDSGGTTFSGDTKLQPGDKLMGRGGNDADRVAYVFLGYDDNGKMIFEEPGLRGRKTGNQNRSSGRTRFTPKSPRIGGRTIQRKGGKAQESAARGGFIRG